MKQRRLLAKQLTSVFMTLCLAAGGLGTFSVPVYGDGEEAQEEAAIASSARAEDERIEETVEALLTKGEYAEGQILVLYDRYASASGEELLGGTWDADENASVTKKTDILIVPYTGFTSNKTNKVSENCRIIPIDQFMSNLDEILNESITR